MHVSIHAKSDFSAGYGTATVDELVQCAASNGVNALALTDIENMYGQVHFHHAARAQGLRAITGVELRKGYGPRAVGDKAGRLVILARDRAGYRSLCRIVTARRRDPGLSSPPPIACLEANPSGVFFLSDDAGVLHALLHAGVPAADMRFLLVRPGTAQPPSGVRAVADTDVVMAHPADRDLHALRLAIRQRRTIDTVSGAEPPERSFAETAMMFHDQPDAVLESQRVAEACELSLLDGPRLPPSIELPPECTADAMLGTVCRERLHAGRRAGRWAGATYDSRLRDELGIIQRLGLADYFLIVREIADHARELGTGAVARGSSVGSLVAHLLGVTTVDPVRHGLYFERFTHPERRDPPDIDLDLPSDRRDEIIDWVFHRFGQERVAMVAAHQRYQRRSAFREGLKAFGMSVEGAQRVCEQLPADDDDERVELPGALLTERFRGAVPLIERLIGTFQHLSVHAGGIVIASPRLEDHAPLERAPKGVRVTQFDMRALAQLGLVKIDLLGNRALAAIDEACRLAGIARPTDEADAATLEALRQGRTIGCFQVETPVVRSTLKKLPLRAVDDLVAALALVRPGPASGEAKAAFIRRAHGEEAAEPPHPRLARTLRETYGILLYEEDLMAAISLMTGWPLARADLIRAALVRNQREPEALAALGRSFTEAGGRTGVIQSEALRVWRILERFAAYSFSKAHASSYAQLAWQSVFLKTHRPAEFACAVLNHYGGHYPLRTVAADFARSGVRLLPPHVNASGLACEVHAGAVRVGLGAVRRVTATSRAAILAARPFRDIRDLFSRVPLSHRDATALFLSGACDGLAPLDAERYPFPHKDLLDRLRQASISSALGGFTPREARGPRARIHRSLVRIRHELEYLQMHLTAHPMSVLREEAAGAGCIRIAELSSRPGGMARIAGVVAAARRVNAHGRAMQFVTLEDESGLAETLPRHVCRAARSGHDAGPIPDHGPCGGRPR